MGERIGGVGPGAFAPVVGAGEGSRGQSGNSEPDRERGGGGLGSGHEKKGGFDCDGISSARPLGAISGGKRGIADVAGGALSGAAGALAKRQRKATDILAAVPVLCADEHLTVRMREAAREIFVAGQNGGGNIARR